MRHPIAVTMMLSLVIKLVLFSFEQVVNPDGVLYIAAARQIADGNLGQALRLYPMPAYPLLIAMVHFVIPDWITAGRVIGIAALVLATIPLYGIARILFSRQAAFWAALCFAVTPEANEQALMVIRDPVFLLMALTSVWFFVKSLQERNWWKVALALLFTGLSFLFRVEGVVFWGAPILFLALISFLSKDDLIRRFARKAVGIWVGVPIGLILIIGVTLGPGLLDQNRLDQLMTEIKDIIEFEAFDNYQEIYHYFKAIESEPPFSGFSKSLPAIVRHWMPLIYLIGLLEYFVKQMFPLFLLPLLVVILRYRSNKGTDLSLEKRFVLVTWLAYMLLILYFFMVNDFIQGRFLFTPAILMYPWVGYGIILIFKWLEGRRFAQLLKVALVFALIISPCMKSAKNVFASDRGPLYAGRYLSSDPNFSEETVLYSDSRLWLYADGSNSYLSMIQPTRLASRHIQNGNTDALEQLALQQDAKALVLAINFGETYTPPRFDHYKIYKRFPSRKEITIIYIRNDKSQRGAQD